MHGGCVHCCLDMYMLFMCEAFSVHYFSLIAVLVDSLPGYCSPGRGVPGLARVLECQLAGGVRLQDPAQA